ncbi:MAG: LysR substrate-binding domain-containing protein [Gemmatimonadota bacterium]
MALNLHHLRIFARVAELGGFSLAAASLRLSQPAVSKSVRELERQLQTTLFDRSFGAHRLTDSGSALFTRARELFAVERAAEEELRTIRGLEGGILRIGASTTIATYLLPELLARFLASHPKVSLRVRTANTSRIADALLGRTVDVALVEGPVEDAHLETHAWRDDELSIIAPPTHPLAKKRRVKLADLANAEFIVRERGSGTREVAAKALSAAGVAPRVVLVLSSTEAITQAVSAGLGLAIVSRVAIADQIALDRVVTLSVHGLTFPRALNELRLKGRPPSDAAAIFRRMIHTTVN